MQKIKFGAVLSRTGNYSIQGEDSFRGLNLWVKNVNRAGGIFVKQYSARLPVELRCYDDESSADKCGRLTEKLILDDEVDILIGPYSSGHTLAVAPIAEKYKKTLWNHGGSSDEIFGKGFTHIVSAITPASRYLTGVIDVVRGVDVGASGLVVFQAEDSGFSTNVAEGAKRYAEEKGFQVREFRYASGTKDFSDSINQVKKQPTDVILGVGRFEDDLFLAKGLIEKRVKAKSIGLVAAGINDFEESFGRYAEGFLGPSQWEPGLRIKPDFGPTPQEFFIRFQEAYDKEPSYPAAQSYNIGLIVQRCIEESGVLDDLGLREAANRTEFKTFYGRFKIDPATGNQIGHSALIVQWQGGRRLIVHPKEMAETHPTYPRS